MLCTIKIILEKSYSMCHLMCALWAKLFPDNIDRLTLSNLPIPLNEASFKEWDLQKLPKLIILSG